MSFEFAWTNANLSPTLSAGSQAGVTSGTIILSNSNNVTFGMSGSSIVTASVGNTVTFNFFANLFGDLKGTTYPTSGASLSLCPYDPEVPFPGVMTVSTCMVAVGNSSQQTTAAGTLTVSLGLYTLNASTLSLLNSVSTSITWAAVSNNSTAFQGSRWLTFHSSQWSAQPTLSQTNYWVGLACSSSSQTQGFMWLAQDVCNNGNIARFGTVGVSAGASISTAAVYPFWGAVATNGVPSSLAQSQVVNVSANGVAPLQYIVLNNALGTF